VKKARGQRPLGNLSVDWRNVKMDLKRLRWDIEVNSLGSV
jgi:hypothetical protein